jgi:hypothetical protein
VLLAALSSPQAWTSLSLQSAAITPVYAVVTLCVVLQPNLGGCWPCDLASYLPACCFLSLVLCRKAIASGAFAHLLACCPPNLQPFALPARFSPCRHRLTVCADAGSGGGGGGPGWPHLHVHNLCSQRQQL